MDGSRKNVRFSTENWPYFENGKMPKIAIDR